MFIPGLSLGSKVGSRFSKCDPRAGPLSRCVNDASCLRSFGPQQLPSRRAAEEHAAPGCHHQVRRRFCLPAETGLTYGQCCNAPVSCVVI